MVGIEWVIRTQTKTLRQEEEENWTTATTETILEVKVAIEEMTTTILATTEGWLMIRMAGRYRIKTPETIERQREETI